MLVGDSSCAVKPLSVAMWLVLTILATCFGFYAHAATDKTQEYSEAEKLVGVWGAQRDLGASVQGRLRIYERAAGLEATIAGISVPVSVNANKVTFTLPRNAGSYRGTFSKDRSLIEGHWIQPRGVIEDYEFATPVDLSRAIGLGWEGTVRVFEERFSLYLRIKKEPDGLVSAILRNPERNVGVRLRIDHVGLAGDEVRFYSSGNELEMTGTWHPISEVEGQPLLSVLFRGVHSFDFTPRSRGNAPGYYPRSDQAKYEYVEPIAEGDGWSVATASSVGVQEDQLAAFVQQILDTETNSYRTPYIQDVVMARHGKLILDEHFYGYHGDLPHDSRSAGKSITSMAVGVAVAEGAITTDTKVYSVFPQHHQHPDPRKASITVEHLLTMTSGYACDDNNENSPGNEGNMQFQGEQTDWIQFTLDLPMSRAPGVAGVYCTGGIHLLAGLVAETTSEWFPDFFRSRLAKPLGIRYYHMNLDPLQRGYGGGGLRLLPRDFLKFGQTMLDDGVWNGKRVLPSSWVRASLEPHASVNIENDYGYAWWRSLHSVAGHEFESWSATGNGGQLIIIVPAYDLVMAFNGANYNNFPTWIAWRDKLMPMLVANAVRQSTNAIGNE